MKKRTDQDFYDALEAVGHKLVRNKEGKISDWEENWDIHNGPGCEICRETWCIHCEMRKPKWNFPRCEL